MAAILDATVESGPPTRGLWRLLNDTRVFHPGAIRVCCAVLALAFGGMAALRSVESGQAGFLIPRTAMMAYALIGAVVGPRFTWYGLRAYTVGLALILPLTASYVIGMEGYHPADVVVTALATFVPYIFLLCGWDFLIASALLLVGQGVILHLVPEPITPRLTIWGVQLSTMGCGTAAGVLLVTFRGLAAESHEWWQASHARERTLREFAEVAAASTTSDTGLAALAAAFARTVPGSACAFVIQDEQNRWHIAAGAGLASPTVGRLRRPPESILALAGRSEHEICTHRDLAPESLRSLTEWVGVAGEPGGVTILPLGGLVPGFIVLLVADERAITPEALRVWAAMAHQSAVTVANVEAWTRLTSQEAATRHLSEERMAVAEMRARFVTQASHEFRTPLAIILSASESIERYGDRLAPEQRDQKAKRIRDAVHHMTSLLDDVLALGRAEAKGGIHTRQPTDLKALCQAVLAEIQEGARATHQLRLHCAQAEVVHAVDPPLMRGVVSNLLSNAVKYSPAGGPVELSLERRDGAVVLRVRDHGCGIAPEDRDHVFESFWRGSNVSALPGSGLGLAIVQRSVAAHDGTIHIESAVGVGTTVEILLPETGTPDARAQSIGGANRSDDA